MFSGIIQSLGEIVSIDRQGGLMRYAVRFPSSITRDLSLGGSFSIDGVCQTVVNIEGEAAYFEAIQETLRCTTLDGYECGRMVNGERSLRMGDEIGGHLLSGHVFGVASIASVQGRAHRELQFHCPKQWMKYIFFKGYIAVDGVSLTVGLIDPEGCFSVHLIPETLKRTALGGKKEGDLVNIELDSHTQTIVNTVERIKNC